MTESITLRDYQRAERELEERRARIGFIIHAVVTALVSAALITVNVVVAAEFPWSPFPVVGMSIGLAFHYVGIRQIDRAIAAKQAQIEDAARRNAA